MEVDILQKKQRIISNIINTDNEELLEAIDLFFPNKENDIPEHIQKIVLERLSLARQHSEKLVSEQEFYEFMETI
jgi:hypothetical protein